MLRRLFSPSVVRMKPSFVNQNRAVQELVRPWEVQHLLPRHESPWAAPLPERVAQWLVEHYRSGKFAYRLDPGGSWDYWRSPAETLRGGVGDCEDFALVVLSLLTARGVTAELTIGQMWTERGWGEHAWVEGLDHLGWFLIEATSGGIFRHGRPFDYQRRWGYLPNESRRAA